MVRNRHHHSAFTLIDVIVSMSVVLVLIGLLLPSLSTVNETAHRVVCASNQRQIGLSLAMYADDWDEYLPPSVFLRPGSDNQQPEEMMTIRLDPRELPIDLLVLPDWDGLGVLYASEYMTAPRVYYCPSHHGNNPYERYADNFGVGPGSAKGSVVSNFHYRGEGPDGQRFLFQIRPLASSLVTDGMRDDSDFNHPNGANVLRADISVQWFSDAYGQRLSFAAADDPGGFGNQGYDPWSVVDGEPKSDD